MRLVSLRQGEDAVLGVETEGGVLDVRRANALGGGDLPETLSALLAGGDRARAGLEALIGAPPEGAMLAADAVRLAPCVPAPGKIVCVGLNYRRHAAEAGMAVPETPVLFPKYANGLAAHGDSVAIPRVTEQADYEAELAVVIGRRARDVSEGDALDHVFGYCNANDLSARDLQMQTGQWMLGKILDGFLPIGPELVTADEVGDPNALTIRAWRNGALRQDSNTADMVFSVEEIVSYISRHMTLDRGDLILTGTPEGVVFGDDPAHWLEPGDVIDIEVEGLGRLRTTCVAAD